jgi:hypothetical protein
LGTGGQWLWGKVVAGLKINRVNHLFRRQHRSKAIGNGECRMEVHRDSQEVGIGANRKIVGRNKNSDGEVLAGGQRRVKFNGYKFSKKLGHISLRNLSLYGVFPLLRAHF